MREVDWLLSLLDQAYDSKSWHGTNLRGSIRGLTPRQVSWRPRPDRHNIWEIVVHAAYWKYAVWRRLASAPRGSFPLEGSNWFRRPERAGDRGWRQDVALLDEMHRLLRDGVERLTPKGLGLRRRGSPFDNRALVTGAAAHDLYHAGQIQLLKRLRPARK